MNLTELRQDRSALLAELELAGARIRGNAINCPLHQDERASAGLYQSEDGSWRFKCHGCDFCGDVFDLRSRITNRPLAEVLVEAAGNGEKRSRKHRSNRNEQSNTRQTKVFPTLDALRAALPGQFVSEHPYVNPDTGKVEFWEFRLKVDSEKTCRLASPVENGFVMSMPEKPWILYQLNLIAESDEVVIVEGPHCADALSKYGIVTTTSVLGAGKSEHTHWGPVAGKRVTLWPDADAPGLRHMRQVQLILERLNPPAEISWVEPSLLDLKEGEDVVDVIEQLQKLGKTEEQIKNELQHIIAKAKPCRISEGLRTRLNETISGQRIAIDWPWQRLSKLSQSLLPETVTILCGDPGATKSFALLQALGFWFEQGIKTACLQLEENRTYHLHRVLAQLEGNGNLFDSEWVRDNPDQVKVAFERHKDFMDRFGKILWQRPDKQASLEFVAQWVRKRAEEGCRIIVVDPVSAVEPVDKVWIADSKFIMACKTGVETFGSSLILVLHPRKGAKGAVGLDDLAGGASYQRLSQTIIWLERHKKRKEVLVQTDVGRTQITINRTVHLCKTRNGPGHGLSLGFEFNGSTLLLSEQGLIVDQD